MSRHSVVLAAALLALAPAALAAPPAVPVQISYQGVLLDTAGQPRTGNVDLTLRIFDSLGGGALVYKQVFLAVPLSDGVFSVRLGPTGSATDTPTNPLTTSLADALAGDAGPTAPARFLQVTVGAEGALARTQILATPYALRAASADTAAIADNVTSINGLDAGVLNQMFELGNTDTVGPLNSDPAEGTADTDGDGAMNFADPDNDDDGIPDGLEVIQGSNLNLVTPTLSSLVPSQVFAELPDPVTLNGQRFDPAMTVFLGGSPIAASDVTPTTARIQPGLGLGVGSLPVFVELSNGERSVARTLSLISGVPPGQSLPDSNDATVSVAVQGSGRPVVSGATQYAVDTNGDAATDLSVAFNEMFNPAGGTPSQIAVAWAPDGRLVGLRCHPNASGCQIQVIRDADSNYTLDAETDEVLLGPSYTGTQLKIWGPGLAFDASGNLVAAYTQISDTGAATPTVLHDRDGSGAFSASAPETVAIETLPSSPGNLGSLAIDHFGRVAYAYAVAPAGFTLGMRIAYDRNGDGDYADGGPPETFTPFATGGGHGGRPCGGVAFDASGRLAALFAEAMSSVRLFRDLSNDGDFTDPGDVQSVLAGPTAVCAIAGHPTGGIAAAFPALHVDRNDDGDFSDPTEATGVSVGGGRLGVTFTTAGRAWVAGVTGDLDIDPL